MCDDGARLGEWGTQPVQREEFFFPKHLLLLLRNLPACARKVDKVLTRFAETVR